MSKKAVVVIKKNGLRDKEICAQKNLISVLPAKKNRGQ